MDRLEVHGLGRQVSNVMSNKLYGVVPFQP